MFMIFNETYVYDIFVISPNLTSITFLLQSLHSQFSIRDLGPAKFILGIELILHSLAYLLSQQKYITNTLAETYMDKCKPLGTPWPLPNSSSQSNISDSFHNPSLYCSIVGSLQYVTITWPNIAFVVNKACQRMHEPSEIDWNNVKHLLCYLKGSSLDNLLFYSKSNLSLQAFSDADWAGCNLDHKSTNGFLV